MRRVIQSVFGIAFCLSLVSCHSSIGTTQTPPHSSYEAPVQPKFNLFISGSGIDGSPFDEFKLDTALMMSVRTSFKGSTGKWRKLNALARLEPVDYDTLSHIVNEGKLATLDSADVTEQCPGSEHYIIAIIPPGKAGTHLQFSKCATDYNLLLQPQRAAFKNLIDWFDRMRVKYRPYEPE